MGVIEYTKYLKRMNMDDKVFFGMMVFMGLVGLGVIVLVMCMLLGIGKSSSEELSQGLAKDVTEFYLPDGTRCATLHHGSLSCDWRRNEKGF